jgi:iron(III) transport system substrate-binding protein
VVSRSGSRGPSAPLPDRPTVGPDPAPCTRSVKEANVRRTCMLRGAAALAAAVLTLAACGDADDLDAALDETAGADDTTDDPDPAGDGDADDEPADDGAADGDAGSLVFYSAGPGGLANDLVAAFTAETGIEVEMFQSTSGDVLGRLEAEINNPIADVVYLASWVPAVSYKEQGRTQPHVPEGVELLHDGWADPDGHFHGRDGSALAMTVNTDLAPSIPTDWSDLAAEEWADLVIMPDPQESGTARDFVAAFVDAQGEDAAFGLFDALADNGLAIEGPNRPAVDSVVAGAHAAVIAGVDYMGYGDIADGEPLEVVMAASGTVVTPRPVFITEWAENVDEARAFIDFLFSDTAQQIVVDRYLIPARSDIEVQDIMIPYDQVPLLDFDWANVEATGDDLLAEFVARYIR